MFWHFFVLALSIAVLALVLDRQTIHSESFVIEDSFVHQSPFEHEHEHEHEHEYEYEYEYESMSAVSLSTSTKHAPSLIARNKHAQLFSGRPS